MAERKSIQVSGRIRLAVIGVTALAIVAAAFLSIRRVEAQGTTTATPIHFPPINLTTSLWGIDNEYVYVDMFLPDTTNAATPFRVQALTNHGLVELAVPQGPEQQIEFVGFITTNPQETESALHLTCPSNNNADHAIKGVNFTELTVIRIVPATRASGAHINPYSAGISVTGNSFVNLNDLRPFRYEVAPATVR